MLAQGSGRAGRQDSVDLTSRPPGRRRVLSRDAGVTMIELLVGMVIVAILSSLSVSGWASYQRANEHRAAAQAVTSTLRNAQQLSLAEAVTYCIAFDAVANTYQVYKFACGATGTAVGSARGTGSSRVDLLGPSFLQATSSSGPTVSFYPRGSATQGSVQIRRDSGDVTYTITVEGLTGRVALNG